MYGVLQCVSERIYLLFSVIYQLFRHILPCPAVVLNVPAKCQISQAKLEGILSVKPNILSASYPRENKEDKK
jgi:hypothetical protein